MVKAIAVAKIRIAGVNPFADESAVTSRPLVPIAFGACRPAHDEFADLCQRRLPRRLRPTSLASYPGNGLPGVP